MGLEAYKREFIHFGLTSQDINNTAVPLSIKEAIAEVFRPAIESLVSHLRAVPRVGRPSYASKTHGQPASPTHLGKEIGVFAYRLRKQLEGSGLGEDKRQVRRRYGQFQCPTVWLTPTLTGGVRVAKFLSERLGIKREALTTQISN